MKCWILTATMLLVAVTALAEQNPPSRKDVDVVDENSLDFSAAEAFAEALPREIEWLPPPVALDNFDPGPGGTCVVDLSEEFGKSEFVVWPFCDFKTKTFPKLAAATIVTKCESGKCSCGEKCGCKAGDKGKCGCGPNCQCDKGSCKCGKYCQCGKTNTGGKCGCGVNCQCDKSANVKVARCPWACPLKVADADRQRFFAEVAARCGKYDYCASCAFRKAENAQLKHELDIAYQQLRFEQRLAQLQAENQRREFDMLLELAEVRAQAAAHQAALEQQSVAQHQQQELVNHIVKLTGGAPAAKPAESDHLRLRIEQLTIENVQLRHTIEELRKHVEHLARQPGQER